MKKVLSVLVVMIISATMSFATNIQKETFKVYGACDMCKERIEKAAKDLDGVSSAEWDKETKMLTIEYDKELVKIVAIHKAIAKAGHDTDKLLTSNEAYEKLHECCKYDRNPMAKKSSCCSSKKSSCSDNEKKSCGHNH